MALLEEFADRLRLETDLEVHGAYTESAARKAVRRDAAFLLLLSDDSRPSEVVGAVRQIVDVEVGVLIRVQNRRDSRGEAGLSEVEDARAKVFGALLGWVPASAFGPVEHRRGRAQPPERDQEQWWLDSFHVEQLRTG